MPTEREKRETLGLVPFHQENELERANTEIHDGMLQWEPGSLSIHTVERILQDALADLWQQCYRGQADSAYNRIQQNNLFREKLMQAIQSATNEGMRVI